MRGSEFDEVLFFKSLGDGNVRSLLIGRRALVLLGLPVLTADYDPWIHTDDIGALNALAERFGLLPNRGPEEARLRGRYVLERLAYVRRAHRRWAGMLDRPEPA